MWKDLFHMHGQALAEVDDDGRTPLGLAVQVLAFVTGGLWAMGLAIMGMLGYAAVRPMPVFVEAGHVRVTSLLLDRKASLEVADKTGGGAIVGPYAKAKQKQCVVAEATRFSCWQREVRLVPL